MRDKGLLNISGNFEPQNSAPLDARSRVETKASLLLSTTWESSDGGRYIYNGMLVSVYNDTNENNGLYILKNASAFDNINSWEKINSGETLANRVLTDTTNFDNLLSSNVDDVQKALDVLDDHRHEEYKVYAGFENRTDSIFNNMIDDEFSISPVIPEIGYKIYIGKEVFTIYETLTISVTTDRRIHYIFFNYNGGIPYLDISLEPWDIKDRNFIPVAIVFKDGSNYAVTDERHSYNRNIEWHDWVHKNIGAMYNSGLTGTFTDNALSVERGVIYDEDIKFDTGETKTTTSLWYRDTVAGQMRMIRNSPVPYITVDDGFGTQVLAYENNGVLTPVPEYAFAVNWVYCSNDPQEPIYTVVSQKFYSSLWETRNAVRPEIPLSTAEWKLLYKVVYIRTVTGGVQTVEHRETTDYRNVQTGVPYSTPTSISHAITTGRDSVNSHPSSAISVDLTTLTGNFDTLTEDDLQSLIEFLDAMDLGGTDGINGLSILSGDVDPTTEGVDGDLYLNLISYDLFKKVSGSWVLRGNIKGADGITPDTTAFYKNNTITANISTTYNIDLNNAENFNLTLTGNTNFTLTPINKDDINQSVTILFKMDSIGGWVLSTNENIYWKNELPTFNTDPNAVNVVTLFSVDKGVTWYGHLIGTSYVNV